MDLDKYKEYAPVVLRLGMGAMFLWFGMSQLLDADMFLGYVPGFALSMSGLSAETLVMVNGIFETIAGLLLLAGLFTRIAAGILALHLTVITFSLGYNDIAVRDAGLTVALIALVLGGADKLSLDAKRARS